MKVIDRQPLHEKNSEVWTPDGIALVKPFQNVVMVSLSIGDTLEPGARLFPSILDTGLNHNFAIRLFPINQSTNRERSRDPTSRCRRPTTTRRAG